MGVLKKAFDNDSINLDEYLRSIRTLAKKQCKQIIKINRLTKTGGGMTSGQPGMMGPPGQQMPGMPGMPPQGAAGMPGMMQPGQQPGMMMAPPGM